MRSKELRAFAWLPAAVLLCSCSILEPPATGTPPVAAMMPDLPGYKVIEGVAVQDYLAGLAEGSALLAANPQMLLLIGKVDQAIACYQDAGAVQVRIYADEAFPLSSGVIAIADRNRLADPAILLRCIGGQLVPFSSAPTPNPCVHSYTLEQAGNEFYVAYIGTTQEICQRFCAGLAGCAED